MVHLGDAERASTHRGGELILGTRPSCAGATTTATPRWAWRCLGGLWLNYAEAHDLLPEIVGAGELQGRAYLRLRLEALVAGAVEIAGRMLYE